ncbi:MAG: MFS transporter [Nitrososphaerales archaeon]
MQYKWVALSNTTIGTLMSSLDTNIVLIALPTIGRELPGTSLFDLVWTLLGYQLITASVLVNFGRLSDIFGRVRLYTLGFAIFTVGSALCSVSQSGTQLVLFRMVQAVGSAFLFSNSAAILTDAFPLNERGKALGINQTSIVAGSVVGLVLGGILASSIGWRSIFWVNIPIGVFATAWSHYKLRELNRPPHRQKIDLLGNLTFAGGLSSILVAITLNIITGLSAAATYGLLGLGCALLVVFFVVEERVEAPMLALSLFRIRAFAAGNLAIVLNSLARGAVTLVLVFYLQGPTMGLNAFTAGVFLIPTSASLAVFGPISGWLSDRYGARLLSTLGLVVSCCGFLLLTQLGETVTFPGLAAPLLLVGSGMGLFAAPNRASIMNSVPAEDRGIASGISVTFVNLGSTLSLAVAFLVMAAVTPIKTLVSIFLGTSGPGTPSSDAGFIASIHLVFLLSTVFLLVAILPSALRGRRAREVPVVVETEEGPAAP